MISRYWLFVFLTLCLTSFVGYGTYRTGQLLRVWRPDRNLFLLPGEVVVRLILVAACIGLGIFSGLHRAQFGWIFPRPLIQILWGIGWGCGLALLFYLTTQWLVAHTGWRFYSPAVLESITPRSRREGIGVTLVMIPAVILEELLFRSLLLGGLLPVIPAVLLLVGASIAFGLMHSPQGLWGMFGASLAGLLLGVIFSAGGQYINASCGSLHKPIWYRLLRLRG